MLGIESIRHLFFKDLDIEPEEESTPEQYASSERREIEMCPLCLGNVENRVKLCYDKSHVLCKECAVHYINNIIDTSIRGTCPRIYCPFESHGDDPNNKKKIILRYESWAHIEKLSNKTKDKYTSLASSLVELLCGGCHKHKTLDQGYQPNAIKLKKLIENDKEENKDKPIFKQFMNDALDYSYGKIDQNDFYTKIISIYLGKLSSEKDDDNAWNMFKLVLKNIQNPERRTTLHLRYIKDRPKIRTNCCPVFSHCFKCKIKNFHEGKLCPPQEEEDVADCPNCKISVSKGDGCNTLTCFCGKQFSWDSALASAKKCREFFQKYPVDTSKHCAKLMCETFTFHYNESLENMWYKKYNVDVSIHLKEWFKNKYSMCPSQCSIVLQFSRLPLGVKLGATLWKLSNDKEIRECTKNILHAQKYIMDIFFSTNESKAIAVVQRMNGLFDNCYSVNVTNSLMQWEKMNTHLIEQKNELFKINSAKQFNIIYGNSSPFRINTTNKTICVNKWDISESHSKLKFSGLNNTNTVQRTTSAEGTYSTYSTYSTEETEDVFRCQFAIAKPLNIKYEIHIIIDELEANTQSFFSFGLVMAGPYTPNGGFGVDERSWVLYDQLNIISNCFARNSGRNLFNFNRKLKVGDILSGFFDLEKLSFKLALNKKEAEFTFQIMAGTPNDYYFALVLPYNSKVSLYDPYHDQNTTLNYDNIIRCDNFKQQLKRIYSDDINDLLFNDSIIEPKQQWISYCNNDKEIAEERFNLMEKNGLIHDILHNESLSKYNSMQNDFVWLNWKSLLYAISWYCHCKNELDEEYAEQYALEFLQENQPNEYYVAAQYFDTDYTRENRNFITVREKKKAIAFMQMFYEDMNMWYDENCGFDHPDPIINVHKECRCLPRHTATMKCCKQIT
jgi:hypothetical protein